MSCSAGSWVQADERERARREVVDKPVAEAGHRGRHRRDLVRLVE
jgi:hypothetical protein